MLQAQEETARLHEKVSILTQKLGNTCTKAQLRNAQAEIYKRQLEENGELNPRMLCIDNLSGDELSISFYTGIVMTRMNLVIQYLLFQLFREKLYRPFRMFCRCLRWMIFP